MVKWSFEDGWYHPDDIPELQIPVPFQFSYEEGDNPVSDDPWNDFVRPEVRTLPREQLPPDEQDVFILDGDYCVHAFKSYGAWNAAFHVEVELEEGIYLFEPRVYGDMVVAYTSGEKVPAPDPLSGRIRIHVDDFVTTWADLAPLRYMRYPLNIIVQEKRVVNISVEFMLPYAIKNNGLFADLWTIKKIHDLDDCPEVRGQPREQYDRTYVLIPPDHDSSWGEEIMYTVWDDKRYTVGGSADDAGIGDLDYRRVVAINPKSWGDDLEGFYKEHYPGVIYESITTDNAQEAAFRLKNDDFDKENGYNGPVYPKTTNKLVGLHIQVLQDNVWEFVLNNPSIMKFFGQTDCGTCKLLNPDTTVIFRHFTPDQNLDSDPHDYIDQFSAGLWEQIDRIRKERPDIPTPYFYAESFNEMYPSLNRVEVQRAANYDIAFAEALHAEFGEYVAPALFCAAIGNPHESEYDIIREVARVSVIYNGLMGYHNYWWANYGKTGILEDWEYHSGRWMGMDEYFKEFGIYARWYGGEGGVVYGMPFLASLGWKHANVYNNIWELYLKDIEILEAKNAAWNAENGNRFIGTVLFTTGAPYTGWEWFQVLPPEIQALILFLLS